HILSHMNWRQPGLATKHAIPIVIKGGINYGGVLSSIEASYSTTKTARSLGQNEVYEHSVNVTTHANTTPNGLQQLEGTIRIDLARYLHLHADLIYRAPTEINQPVVTKDAELTLKTTTVLQEYHFKEHRRMRSKRLHYLDHPKIGLLAYIVQYIPPQAEPTESTAGTIKKPTL
ncbi:MAG: hypothetical protein JKY93_07145, partial [Gammaproteobacteria bacterium]|nr:hypothetical protein [Gammaproteobacteria bacterium]